VAVGFELLHHLELDVLEVGLAMRERLEFVAQTRQLLRACASGVEPLLITRPTGADLLDVGVRLALRAAEIGDRGAGANAFGGLLGELGHHGRHLGGLGQGPPSVGDLVEAGVDVLELQKRQLGGQCSSDHSSSVARLLMWTATLRQRAGVRS
jgi:hypothetical protein